MKVSKINEVIKRQFKAQFNTQSDIQENTGNMAIDIVMLLVEKLIEQLKIVQSVSNKIILFPEEMFQLDMY